MKRLLAVIGLIGLASVAAQPARSEVGFSIYISNAPPPPRAVFYHQPRFVLVPEEDVYVCDDEYTDYDVFRYGGYYYMFNDGYWYRSSHYRGPFMAIRVQYVPRPIFVIGDYGYRWRERPRYQGTYVRSWSYGDNRYTRDWRSYGDRRTRYSTRTYDSPTRYRRDDGTDRRYVQPAEPRRDRRGDGEWRDRQGDQGRGNGRGKGQGKGRGQDKGRGRGHDGD